MGASTNTSTSTSGPTDPNVQKTLDQLLGGVQDIWKQGPQVYGSSLYSPAGATTNSAWAQGTNQADSLLNSGGLLPGQRAANGALQGLSSGYGSLTDNNGLTAGQSGAIGQLGGVANGYGSLTDNNGLTAGQGTDLSGVNGLAGKYAALGSAYDQTAPGYQNVRNNAGNDALTSVNGVFNSSGRLGGGSNVKSAGEGVTNALSALDYQNYQNSVNNKYTSLNDQQGALSNAFGMGQTGVGNQLAGLGGQNATLAQILSGEQTGVGNQLAGYAGQQGVQNQLFNNGQTALNNTNNAIATLGGVGGAQDANQQGILTGNANLYNAQHNGKLALLQQLLGGLSGSANVGGTTQTNTTPATPWWQSALGIAAQFV